MLYPQAQSLYIQAGWTTDFNILPVKGKSQDLPVGFTGYTTNIATAQNYELWARQKPEYNITLALIADSEFVLFDVDTDHEKGKEGYVQWFEFWDSLGIDCAEIDAQCWISSARPNPSARGQRLVRVPKGLEWPSKLDADIEIIRYGHRHAVVYPSIHPETGTEYRWYQPGTTENPSDRIPTPKEIAFTLPDEAVRKITGGLSRKDRPARKDMGWTDVSDWLVSRAEAEGTPCVAMADQLDRAKDYILNRHTHGLDVHHAALKGTDSLIHLAHEGHSGAVTALQELYGVFTSVSTTRDSDETLHVGEWKRAIEGSVAKMKGDPDKSCWCGLTAKRRNNETPAPEGQVSTPETANEAYERAVQARVIQMRIEQDAKTALLREQTEDFSDESVADALDALLAGDDDLYPTVGPLVDSDRGLFYAGQINGIYGDGGTGKTLYLTAGQTEELNKGHYVVHWEFDNNPTKRIVRRLLQAGADPDDIRDRFLVLRSVADKALYVTADIAKKTSLVTLDALTPAINSLGGDVNQPSGTDSVFATYLSPFTVHGACGIYIDHVGHENKDRQSGSVRKFQATQGALYEIKSKKKPSIGGTGLAELILRKDNQGGAGEINTTAAYITYQSTMSGKLTVTASKGQNPTVLDQLDEDAWKVAKANAAARAEMVDDKVVSVLEELHKAANAREIHEWLKASGTLKGVTKAEIQTSIERLVYTGRLGKDERASATGTQGGRPTDRYRPLTPNWG